MSGERQRDKGELRLFWWASRGSGSERSIHTPQDDLERVL